MSMNICSRREFLRRQAWCEAPHLTPEQIENYIKELETEHPEWDFNQKVDGVNGLEVA